MTKRFKKKRIPASLNPMRFLRNNLLPTLVLGVLVLAIPLTVWVGQMVSRLLTEAAAIPASIVVDTRVSMGLLPRPWEGVAQGGELENDKKTLVSILPVTGKLRNLNIKYVRFDHIFNFPLEERMKEIRAVAAMGAFPVISLSYYPPSVATSWTGRPHNWAAWEAEVTGLITRISRETPNVYYEVWNEPDGKNFGNMSPREYLTLYRHTLLAAGRITNVQPFKIGGPSMANPDNKNWMKEFVEGLAREELRVDFISWHRYHEDPQVFLRDLNFIDDLLIANRLSDRERLITEWGTNPRSGPIHLSSYEAAHFAAVTRILLDRVRIATKFEARDGVFVDGGAPVKDGEGLGLYTYSGNEKPLTAALKLVNKMGGTRILLSGEGTNVTGYAAQTSGSTNILLVNFDKNRIHTEPVPILIRGLSPGPVQLRKTILDAFNPYGRTTVEQFTTSGELTLTQIMQPNSILLVEIDNV
jgi:beta-xylosidase